MNDGKVWKVEVDYGDSQLSVYSEGPNAAVGTIQDFVRKFQRDAREPRTVQKITLSRAPASEVHT